MRKFYQNKLWRNKLIEMREKKGAIVHFIELSHAEMSEELGMKMLEEANDAYSAETQEEMIDEIVDVLEVIDCILDFHGIPKDQVMALKTKKFNEFGSYTDRRLVDFVEYPAGSQEEKHCLENPDRFPEIEDDEESHKHSINNCCK